MLWIEISKALLTPVLAVVAIWIAWQQFRLAREKVKLELFERRHRVFRATVELVAEIVQNGGATLKDPLRLLRETADAEFLFGQDVVDYIDTLYKRAVELTSHSEEVVASGCGREDAVKKKWERVRWFADQINVTRAMFRPYLRFEP